MPTPSLRLTYPHRELVARIRAEIRRTSWWSAIVQTMLWRWFLEGNWERTVNSLLHLRKKDLRLCRRYDESTHYLEFKKKTSRARGSLRGNTKIGPVLDVKVYLHEGRYCIDIMIEPSFRDKTVSWVRIVSGINKYVTETSEEILVESVELVRTGEPVAKGKPCDFVSCSCSYL